MQASIHPKQLTRSRRARVLSIATLVSGGLVAGCGGSSGSPTTSASSAASGSATTAGSSTAAAGSATSSGSTASGAGGSGPLAFAACMRANGVPNFPDPNPRGGFRLSAGIDSAAPSFRTAQAKCQKLLPGGGLPRSGAPASAQTLAKLLRIAVCMRQHGVPQFPDPLTSLPSNSRPSGAGGEISDFDGAILVFPSTINRQAPAYRQALTACGAPPLGLPH